MNKTVLDQNLAKFIVAPTDTTAEDHSGLTLSVLCNFKKDAQRKTTAHLYQLV